MDDDDWDDGDEDDEEDEDQGEDVAQSIRIPLGNPPVVFAMPGSEELIPLILGHLGWPTGRCHYNAFPNGEMQIKVDQSVANHDVYILCVRNVLLQEINFTIMQLLMLIASIKGEGAYRVTVVSPCFEYQRQDRRISAGEPIPPRLLLRCMKTAGASRFVCVDLHNQAAAAFAPHGMVFDELTTKKYLADFVRVNVQGFDPDRVFVCTTNGGGMTFTRSMANELRTGFMMADRSRPRGGGKGKVKIISDSDAESMESIVVIDDMFDTCGSLAEVVTELHSFAPKAKIYAIGPHGYFSGDAHLKIHELAQSQGLEWIACTNSISTRSMATRLDKLGAAKRLKIVDVSRLLAGAIVRIHMGASTNLPKFRALGPGDRDPVLQPLPDPVDAPGGGFNPQARPSLQAGNSSC